jgi:hypothetical protein
MLGVRKYMTIAFNAKEFIIFKADLITSLD